MTQSQFDRDKPFNSLGVLTGQKMGGEVLFTNSAMFKLLTPQAEKR
jgi:hypothetical protein